MKKTMKRFLLIGIILSMMLSWYRPMEVSAATPVAAIGAKKYTSLEKAIKKVKNGETIKILKNISTPNTIYNARKVSFSIDLNKKTITYTGKNEFFYLYRGTVTIQNGKIKAGKYEVINVGKKAKLIIKNGTYTGGFTNYGKFVIENGKFSSSRSYTVGNAGTCVIRNGTFKSTSDSKVMILNEGKKAKLTIQKGSFLGTSSNLIKNIKGVVTIKGGTYKEKWSEKKNYLDLLWQVSGTMNIYAGTFVSATGHCIEQEAGTMNVKGGNFTTTNNDLVEMCGGKINISGGTLCSNEKAVIGIYSYAACMINVSGGKLLYTPKKCNWYTERTEYDCEYITVKVTGGTFESAN